MSQNDFNIANQGFPATRADINSALQALASTSAGATEPGTIYAYQLWYDETADLLKMRNGDNDAWITLAAFDQAADEWEVRTAVVQAVDSAGVVIKTDDGVARISVADNGNVTIANNLTVSGNIDVSSGTIKLDGNYPVGTNNVALGDIALGDASLSGGNNTAIGRSSLFSNTSGSFNTGIGSGALENNTTASNNTAVGYQALLANTATGNNAIGYTALRSNTTGAGNTADGVNALYSNTTGSNNTSMGFQSLLNNTTASGNTAVGYQVMLDSTGDNNTALGYQALQTNSSGGINNTAIGYQANRNNTSGSYNVAVGLQALLSNTTASNNTAVGYQAGFDNATGERCTFIGNGAGENSTVSDNTFVGQNSGSAITTGAANTILGRFSGNEGGLNIVGDSNHIVLSDGDGNPRLWFNASGNIFAPALGSASTANNDVRYSTANGALYYQTSSARYKENIADLEFDTSNLYNLRPVSFDDKTTGERCYGLIAEETFEQIPELVVTREIDGEAVPDSIPYSMLSVAILNEMKKLKAELEDAKARITALEAS
jgi:trimeric autotransporter adhesin